MSGSGAIILQAAGAIAVALVALGFMLMAAMLLFDTFEIDDIPGIPLLLGTALGIAVCSVYVGRLLWPEIP